MSMKKIYTYGQMAACIWYSDINKGSYKILSLTDGEFVVQKTFESISDDTLIPSYTLQNESQPYYSSEMVTETNPRQVSRYIFKNGFSDSEKTKRNSEFSLIELLSRLNVNENNKMKIMAIHKSILEQCSTHNTQVKEKLFSNKNGGYYFFACFAGFEHVDDFTAFLSRLKDVIDDDANKDIKQLLYRLVSMEISNENMTFELNNYESSDSMETRINSSATITIDNSGREIKSNHLRLFASNLCNRLDTTTKAILGLKKIRELYNKNPDDYISAETLSLKKHCELFPNSVANLTNENPLSEQELEQIRYGLNLIEENEEKFKLSLASKTTIKGSKLQVKTDIVLKNLNVEGEPPQKLNEEFENLVKEKVENDLMETFELDNLNESTRNDIQEIRNKVLSNENSMNTSSLKQSYEHKTFEVHDASEIIIKARGPLNITNSNLVAESAIDVTIGNINEAADAEALKTLSNILNEIAKKRDAKFMQIKNRSNTNSNDNMNDDAHVPSETNPYRIPIIIAISMLIIVIVTLLIVKRL